MVPRLVVILGVAASGLLNRCSVDSECGEGYYCAALGSSKTCQPKLPELKYPEILPTIECSLYSAVLELGGSVTVDVSGTSNDLYSIPSETNLLIYVTEVTDLWALETETIPGAFTFLCDEEGVYTLLFKIYATDGAIEHALKICPAQFSCGTGVLPDDASSTTSSTTSSTSTLPPVPISIICGALAPEVDVFSNYQFTLAELFTVTGGVSTPVLAGFSPLDLLEQPYTVSGTCEEEGELIVSILGIASDGVEIVMNTCDATITCVGNQEPLITCAGEVVDATSGTADIGPSDIFTVTDGDGDTVLSHWQVQGETTLYNVEYTHVCEATGIEAVEFVVVALDSFNIATAVCEISFNCVYTP